VEAVGDRLAELLAKGKAGKLSREETEELARLLNAPIVGPVENSPAKFVSKHRMPETDVVARVKRIDWFAHCGEPREFDVSMEVNRVKTWPQAMKACKARSWHKATLEARNQLTLFLHSRHRERYRDWNKITDKFKKTVIMPLSKKVWEPFRQSHGLDVELVHSIQWNILAALMENAYMGCNHGSYFFLEILSVYEAGHLPCGWRGEWPQDKLVVF
jgi:hypothetical protein